MNKVALVGNITDGRWRKLPTGTVMFQFTDIEGSSRLLKELGPDYTPVQTDHMQIMRDAISTGAAWRSGQRGTRSSPCFPPTRMQ